MSGYLGTTPRGGLCVGKAPFCPAAFRVLEGHPIHIPGEDLTAPPDARGKLHHVAAPPCAYLGDDHPRGDADRVHDLLGRLEPVETGLVGVFRVEDALGRVLGGARCGEKEEGGEEDGQEGG